jgi:tetratricopeptide (TPR) repeat protein
MRQILFIGNCQVHALSLLYERFAGRGAAETVVFLPSYEDLDETARERLATADLIVEQRTDLPPQADIAGAPTSAERLFVPLLAGGFLWPYAGQPHVRNETPWFMPPGPWNAELGDGYLNRLILQDVPPEQAVEQYLALDVNKARNLDRMLELILDRQRARDEACGYDIASVVERHFRTELTFLTPHHPNLRVAMSFATRFFEHMGVEQAAIERMVLRTPRSPFPRDALPIHPSVARHFGLPYATPETRYRRMNEGSYTFAEFALRYMRNEWCRALAEGLANAREKPELALEQLEAGLAERPGSGEGWLIRGEILRRLGRAAEAEASMRRAVEAEPDEAPHWNGLAHLLAELGRTEEALRAIERAERLDPTDPHYPGMHAALAERLGRTELAQACAARVLRLEPGDAHALRLLEPARDVDGLRRAIAADPADASLHEALGAALWNADRASEAADAYARAAELRPGPGPLAALSHALARAGRPDEAAAAIARAIEADGSVAAFHVHHGNMLALGGRDDDAEAAYLRALALDPGSREAEGQLAGLRAARLRRPEPRAPGSAPRLVWTDAKIAERRARRDDPACDRRERALIDVALDAVAGDVEGARRRLVACLDAYSAMLPHDDWTFENILNVAVAAGCFDVAAETLNRRFGDDWCAGVGVLDEAPDAMAVRWTVLDGGTCRFDLFPALYETDHTLENMFHWSRSVSLFHAYVRGADPVRGHADINIFDVGLTPGISCCDDKPGYFLTPDPIFLSSRGYAELRREFEAADVAWADRIPQAFWRGATTGNHQDELERLPRLRLCRLARARESGGLIDAAISSIVQLPPEWAEEVARSGLTGRPVPRTEYLRYKYQIDIDGNTNAWAGLYERLLTGSPVLKVASPFDYRQWFYDRLIPWWTFVPVQSDMSDLLDKMRWLQRNDDIARQIGERGKALALSLDFEGEQLRAAPTLSAALRSAAGLPLVEARLASALPQEVRLLHGWMNPAAGERRVIGYESRLEMQAPIVRGALTLRIEVRALAEPCRLTVVVNGEVVWQGAVSDRTSIACELGEDVRSRRNPLSIQFLHPDRSFPAMPEDGAQPVALGLAFSEVSLLLGAAG